MLHLTRCQAAALSRVLIVSPYRCQAAIECLRLRLDQRDGQTDVCEIHGDAAAHGTRPDNPDLSDGEHRRLCRDIGNFPDLPLRKKHVTLGYGLIASKKLAKRSALKFKSVIEGKVHRGFHAANGEFGSNKASEFAGVALAKRVEQV